MRTYSAEELLRLRRYDVGIPRRTRKTIFSHGIWRPRCERLQLQDELLRELPCRPTERPAVVVPCVFTANLNGGFVRKADELEVVMQTNGVDIACITETWLKETVPK